MMERMIQKRDMKNKREAFNKLMKQINFAKAEVVAHNRVSDI